LISFGSCGNRPYLVTELLRAAELPHSDRKVARFIKKVCSAVAALHKFGYAHRDIKPSNILWREDEPVLIDYGLTCPFSDGPVAPSALSIVDGQRIVVGTAGYAAPEQFAGGRIVAATDVHALGMLLVGCFEDGIPARWKNIVSMATNSNPAMRFLAVKDFAWAVKTRNLKYWGFWGAVAIGFVCGSLFPGLGNIASTILAVGLYTIGLAVYGRIAAAYRKRRRIALWCWGVILSFLALGVLNIALSDVYFDAKVRKENRLSPPDRSFSILPIDSSELMPLDGLGLSGWGMGEEGDCPIVLVQKLAYNGDFATYRKLQRELGATYGGRTIVCEDEITNRVLRVEIDDWREGERLLYAYRKLYVAGNRIYQVTGQTQMRTKARDRDKLKMVVDSFKVR